ncbi:MAG: hypothetical protein N3E52_03625 [Candidatus Bathyarchaeota archaeon]|nr:hypothetical protein [Candidatus Bathyarchaeota archaeon]
MSQIIEQTYPTGERKTAQPTQMTLQEFAETIRSLAEDIGQISEMSSEEKLLVAEFFKSFLKLMQPLAKSIPVSTAALPAEAGNIKQAYVDPTGHIALIHEDGNMELRNLADEQNRDLMIQGIQDVLPKFKTLTSEQKNKIENRIQFLSTVTKEIQRVSDTIATLNLATTK